MSYRKKLITSWITLMVLSVILGSVMAQEDGSMKLSGLRPDAPLYGLRGSHTVGTQELVIEGEEPLIATIWYPALNDDNLEEVIAYPYENSFDPSSEVIISVAGHAISGAPYDLSDGPYPLVILSSGFLMGRTSYAWLAEHLTSHGFVVIAPEHQEQLDEALSDFWRSAINRPQDILTWLDHVDEQVGTGGSLAGLVNADLVAVVGHSYGGYTSLVAAGARYDINSFEILCDEATATGDDVGAWLCGLILPNLPDMAELAGLDSMPEGLWPTWGDNRIDAIVPMAGDAFLFNQGGLSEITIPIMAIGGTLDTGTPYLWGTHPTYEYVSSETKARVALENAEHMIFGATCEAIPWFAEIGFYSLCSDPVWDMNRAHDLVNHFTTAFLLAELKQDSNAASVLAPEAVNFPGVSYDAQGF